jgi:hypothetical protein
MDDFIAANRRFASLSKVADFQSKVASSKFLIFDARRMSPSAREPPLTCASGLDVRDDDLADLRKDGR